MGQKGKFLVTNEGRFDLGTHMWDDQLFTDLLVRDNPINTDQAMGISRSLREEIARMEFQTITLSLFEKMIESKLMEYGLTKPSPIRLDLCSGAVGSFRKCQKGSQKKIPEKRQPGQCH